MSKNRRKNYEDEDDGPLCLCEYYNKNNERTHILFCCCNCEALDETCTYLICQRRNNNHNNNNNNNSSKNLFILLNETLDDILDRIRIPSFNGAIKINSDLLISMITIAFYVLLGTINLIFSILTIILVPTLLYIRYFQLRFYNKSKDRNQIAYYMTLVSLIVIYFLYNLYLKNELNNSHTIHECLFIVVILLHVYLHFSNPGYLTSSIKSTDTNSRYCVKCNIQKNDKISHCPLCTKCIYARDHHCFWIDNCVGYLNHKIFFFYLILLFSFFLYSEIIIFRHFFNIWLFNSNRDLFQCLFNDFYQNFSSSLMFMLFLQLISLTSYSFLILIQQILLISVNYTQYEMYKYSQLHRNFSLVVFLCGNFKVTSFLGNFFRFLCQFRSKKNLIKLYSMNNGARSQLNFV